MPSSSDDFTPPPTPHSRCSLTFRAAEKILCPKPLVRDEVRADDLRKLVDQFGACTLLPDRMFVAAALLIFAGCLRAQQAQPIVWIPISWFSTLIMSTSSLCPARRTNLCKAGGLQLHPLADVTVWWHTCAISWLLVGTTDPRLGHGRL